MAKSYSSQDIQILKGLEAVRTRPGMYIGSTGAKGLHHILWEIIDNSVDEAANGYAQKVIVTLYADGSASVEDDGRGMPVDIHPEAGIFDLVFMDGDKRQYMDYYELAMQYTSPNAIILADNTLWDGHVVEKAYLCDRQTVAINEFNAFVAADQRVEKFILPLRDGLTMIRKKS